MNDERPIEKLLRRYAKKRRAEAEPPLELHAATRRLLQGEVASQYQRRREKGRTPGWREKGRRWLSFEFLFQNVPRLAWVVPLLALAGIGLWAVLDQPAKTQLALGRKPSQDLSLSLAKRERTEADSVAVTAAVAEKANADLREVVANAPRPASLPVRPSAQSLPRPDGNGIEGMKNGKILELEQPVTSVARTANRSVGVPMDGLARAARSDKSGAESLTAAPALTPGLTASADRELEQTKDRSARAPDRNALPAESAIERETKLASAGGASLNALGTFTNLATNFGLAPARMQTYAQSFANQLPAQLKQKVAKVAAAALDSPVLANFRVEQSGRQLRVLDADGSTYLGEIDDLPGFMAGSGGQNETVGLSFKNDGSVNPIPATAIADLSARPQTNFYRVVGTNRTLNQAVVFTFSFATPTNLPLVAETRRLVGELNKDVKKLPSQFPMQLQNSLINGRAQFETGREIEINAIPVTP